MANVVSLGNRAHITHGGGTERTTGTVNAFARAAGGEKASRPINVGGDEN